MIDCDDVTERRPVRTTDERVSAATPSSLRRARALSCRRCPGHQTARRPRAAAGRLRGGDEKEWRGPAWRCSPKAMPETVRLDVQMADIGGGRPSPAHTPLVGTQLREPAGDTSRGWSLGCAAGHRPMATSAECRRPTPGGLETQASLAVASQPSATAIAATLAVPDDVRPRARAHTHKGRLTELFGRTSGAERRPVTTRPTSWEPAVSRLELSRWSARSAARTNDLDGDER
jgi:hypothetical protein